MKKKPVLYIWRAIRRLTVNRKYKDHLFRMIFQDKKDLLELYNAVNNSSYTDPEELTITTLRDVIFLGMKNDLSFLIGSQLNLYEHQSTWNENMPLRGLFYFSDMLRGYVEEHNLNIYKEKRIELPTPKYIVFYNGEDNYPDQVELKLSDAFPEEERESCSLECRVTVFKRVIIRNLWQKVSGYPIMHTLYRQSGIILRRDMERKKQLSEPWICVLEKGYLMISCAGIVRR